MAQVTLRSKMPNEYSGIDHAAESVWQLKAAAMSIEFLLTTLIIVASPGTGVVYTLAAGLSRGGRASVLAAFACTLGIVPHLIAALTGARRAAAHQRAAFEIVKYAGVAYLLYMAWQTLSEHGAMQDRCQARPALAPGGCWSTAC